VDTDRNLLFGVLALQLDLIDRDGFVNACGAWATRKDTPLADVLTSLGLLSADDRLEVERLLERRLKKHGGDVQASLAEAADHVVRGAVAAVGDDDLAGSLPPTPSQWMAVATDAPTNPEQGRYAMLRLAGTGGIGRVWLVRDTNIGREVALKELRPDRAVVGFFGRLIREAQVTGQLEHPGIVPVYEVGRRPQDNQPFYTMRFVRGRTLKDAIAAYHERLRHHQAGPLELRELLGAFVQVCNAVGYAHSRGVLHRDLKPHNVALGDYGEVMVLDWGLAKVVSESGEAAREGAEVNSSTLAPPVTPAVEQEPTQGGAVLGTPPYMAPEQADGRLDLLDARTDVYGLGAILYHLLTGTAPFAGKDTPEVLDRVRHDPPRRPRDTAGGTPPALDAVCLKALAKRREERYPSAKALAAEVQHWLADEPVSCYREPAPVRLARWGRRHKPLVAGAAALLVAAVVALSAGTVLLGRANARIEGERAEVQRQRDRADANFRKARQSVDDYLTHVSENKLLKSRLPGLQPLRKELLEAALPYYEGFTAEAQGDPALAAELARAYYRTGKITGQTGAQEDAIAAYRKSRDLWETLVQDNPDEDSYKSDLADCCLSWGRTEVRKPEEAAELLGLLERARGLYADLAGRHAGSPDYRRGLAECHSALAFRCWANGRPQEELPNHQKALELWEELAREDPKWRGKLASTLMDIGYYYTKAGDAGQSLMFLERARDIFVELGQQQPNDLEFREELRRAYTNIGYLHESVTGRSDLALGAFQQARLIAEAMARDNPAVVYYQALRVSCYGMIAKLLTNRGDHAPAEDYVRRGLEVLDSMRVADPHNVSNLWAIADLYALRARIQGQTNRPMEAVQSLRPACAIMDQAVAANPDSVNNTVQRARCYRLLGVMQSKVGDAEGALKSLGRATESLEAIGPANRATNANLLANLLVTYAALADVQQEAGRDDDAASSYRKITAIWEDDLHGHTDNSQLTRYVIEGLIGYAPLLARAGDRAAALRTARQVEDMARLLPTPDLDDLYFLACARAVAGELVEGPEEGRRLTEQALTDLGRFLKEGGPRTAADLQREPALKPLRERPDFQDLVAELQGKERAAQDERQRFAVAERRLADGNHFEAAQEVNPVFASRFATPMTFFNGSRLLARASTTAQRDKKLADPDRERLARQYAERAVELLREAAAKGFKGPANVGRLNEDPDLDPLRERDDFKKLVADLEDATKPKDKQ
jgi:serine/threonine-protein kinase